MKILTNYGELECPGDFHSFYRRCCSGLKKMVALFCFTVMMISGVQAQQPAPACNLIGPLSACLDGGNILITNEIAFSTENPTLVYTLPVNTTGAYIVSTGPFVYSGKDDGGTQTIVLNPGTTTGQINVELNVTTVGGTSECSKSITIVDANVAVTNTPILCFGGTSTVTATASGYGGLNYTFTLNPGNVVIGPQTDKIATFPNLSAGTYTVSVIDNNGCTDDTTFTITQPPLNPVVPNCPANPVLSACATQEQVSTAFAAWLASFSFTGGTNATVTRTPENPEAPSVCGGVTTVTWTINSLCEPPVTCTRTFTVPTAPTLVATCPGNVSLPACTGSAAILTAYNTWKAGFTVTGGCSPTNNLASFPALTDLTCGGTLSFTLMADNAAGTCVSHKECSSTFTVAAPPALVATCPGNVNLPACTSAADILTAYNTWKAGFTVTGGCSPTNNLASFPALTNLTCGGTLSFTLVADNAQGTCVSHQTCTSTFTVAAPPALVATCPGNVNLPACTSAEAITSAYNIWKAGFTVTGGCSPTNNLATFPALTNLTCGGTLSFTLVADNAQGTCVSHQTCTSTFTVAAPPALVATCPGNVNLAACTSAADILTAYNTWKAGFTVTGGCSPTNNLATFPALTDLTCGGTLSFTLVADNAQGTCVSHQTCTSTFTVAAAPALVATCPGNVSLAACTSTETITAAYNTWKAGFTVTGGCSPTNNLASFPALSDLTCGGTLSFTLVADNAQGACVSHQTCTSTFTVAASPALVATCPGNVNLPACTSTADILTAYNTWKAGFTVTGGCSPTNNLASFPALTNLSCGGSLSFTLVADNTGGCVSHQTCTSTFTVATAPALVATCPGNINLPACTSIDAITTAYNTWKAGFTVTGGCNPTNNLATFPALTTLTCGGTLSFTLVADNTGGCVSHQTCTSTFTVAAAPELVVTCPGNVTINACSTPCTPASIEAAYNTWKAGFTVTGGCNPTNNLATFPALTDLTCGGSLSFTLMADNTGGCISHKECSSTFTVTAPPTLAVSCPGNVSLPACTSASAIAAAYNTWKAGFTISGGCNPADNLSSFPALTDLTCGGTLSFTLSADNTGLCAAHQECSSTFTIAASTSVTLTCPNDTTVAADQTQAAVNAEYATWLARVSFGGGCNTFISNNSISAPNATGGSRTVTFTVFSDCGAPTTCTSTFTVPGCVPPLLGSIGDFVWIDNNQNGSQDDGEPGKPNVTVELYNSVGGTTSGAAIATTTTNASGNYLFSNLPAGTYCVRFVSADGPTIGNIGDDTKDSDPNGHAAVCSIVLAAGENNLTIDAGFLPPSQGPLLQVEAAGSDGPCGTECQGTITVSTTGGVAPITFTWSDGSSTSQNRTGLCPGTYTVTAHDAQGTTDEATVTITAPGACPSTGGKACTPGYWKNHTNVWDSQSDITVDNMPGILTSPVTAGGTFVSTTSFWAYFNIPQGDISGLPNTPLTMAEATGLGGGNCNALARHGVSALLAASAFTTDYPYPSGATNFDELYTMIRNAFLSGDCEPLHQILADINEKYDGEFCGALKFAPQVNNSTVSRIIADDKPNNGDRKITITAYPNPLRTDRVVNFRVAAPTSGNITLAVYDVTGRKLAIIYNGNVTANIPVFAKYNVPSIVKGALFYRLTTADGNVTHGSVLSGD